MGDFLRELGRRKVFRVVALYVVGAWVILQAADLAFPGMQVPESSIRYVWLGAIAALPLVLILGWRFDLSGGRIVRTPPRDSGEAAQLSRPDYVILSTLAISFLAIGLGAAAEILASRAPSSESPASTRIYEKSIAVLPFENLSGDIANEPFTMGVHDDVLTHIAKISDIKVISRTSVMRLDRDMSIPQIAELLDVATVLEGGVQRIGNRIRINAQLIDAATDQHVWSESFDHELSAENIFSIQSDIAAAITDKLRATLSPHDEASLRKLSTRNLQAYEAYLLGKQHMSHRTHADLYAAADYFRTASELDPDYALAFVGLAEASLLLNNYGYLSLDDALEVANPALDTALQLDNDLGAAYAAVGLKHARRGDFAAASAAFERAITLDPNYAAPYHWYGDLLINLGGDPEAAVPLLEKARRLDPLSAVTVTTLGEAFTGVGRFEEAMAQFQKGIEIDPEYPGSYSMLLLHHRSVLGRFDEAVRLGRLELSIDATRNSDSLGMTYLALGDVETARHWIERSVAMKPQSFFAVSSEMFLHLYVEEEDSALEAAARLNAIAPGNNSSLYTLVSYGRYEEVLQQFQPLYPQLSCASDPIVTRTNFFPAINLSLALEKTGNTSCASRMLDGAAVQMQSMPRRGPRGYGFADVEVYSRQGRTRLALDTLRQAIDEGYRMSWWGQTERSPHTTALLDNHEFQGMMDEIRADMAVQLERVRKMEANGELAAAPEPL